MIALVTGGAASGKSAFAESLACALSTTRTYLATMSSEGGEAQERIARHRAQRAGAGFSTIECAGTLAVPVDDGALAGVALLDDVGNLVSRAMFDDTWALRDCDGVLERLAAEFVQLSDRFAHVVIVGNDVGGDGAVFADESGLWVRLVGSLCCKMAERCDCVVEVVAGKPSVLKGALDDSALAGAQSLLEASA